MNQNTQELELSARETPIIPPTGEIKDWKHVYFHSSTFGSAIPILNQGIWSVAFSRLVGQPIEPSGFSPVQEEIGWDKISVFDGDDPQIPYDGYRILPGQRNVTFVLRKMPHKSSPVEAERKLPGEHSIQWRIAPRDIVALWVNKDILDLPLTEFLDRNIAPDMYERLRALFNRLTRNSPKLREKMVRIGNEELAKANERYTSAYWKMIGEIAKENQTKSFAREWIADNYHIDTTTQKVVDLLKALEESHGIRIYSVNTNESQKRAIPVTESTKF